MNGLHGTHRPVSGSKRFVSRRSRQGRGDAGGGDKGSGTAACVTGGSRVGAVLEDGAVGAFKVTSLAAGDWDGGVSCSWQGGGGVEGCGPNSIRRCRGGGDGAGRGQC